MSKAFKLGDIVTMSSPWIKSTQAHQYGSAHGRITQPVGPIVEMEWIKGRSGFHRAHVSNLVLVSRLHLEPA